MEVRYYFALLWKWAWLVILGGVVAGAAAFFISKNQTPVYEASSILLIVEGTPTETNQMSAIQYSERLAESYATRLKNQEVLAEALANVDATLSAEKLEEAMTVSRIGQSQLIRLTVQHTSPEMAAGLANEIPSVFAERNQEQQLQRFAATKASLLEEMARLEQEIAAAEARVPVGSQPVAGDSEAFDSTRSLRETYARLREKFEEIRIAEASSLNNILIDEAAQVPIDPVRPRTVTNTLLAAVAGVMLSIGVIFLVEYLDDTIKTPEQVEELFGLNTVGQIRQFTAGQPEETVIVQANPRSPAAEAYRQLRTNLQYLGISKEVHSLLITSGEQAEGKTTTAANLAAALAQAGKKTILIDCDLRKPMLHKLFGLPNQVGVTDLLLAQSNESLNMVVRRTNISKLFVITSGTLPPNPAELLGSQRFADVLALLEEHADYVVLDSPPLLAVTDATVLSQQVDATLLVVGKRTRVPVVEESLRRLNSVNARIAGAAIYEPTSKVGYYYKPAYYHYGETHPRKGWQRWVPKWLL